MKKYNIYKTTKEIKERNMCDIVEGCTVSGDDIFSELVKSCDTLEEAGETLKRYKTDITPYDGCQLRNTVFYQKSMTKTARSWSLATSKKLQK